MLDKKIISKNKDIFGIVSAIVLVGAFLVITMISLLSEHGIHPDEYDVKACLDWAMGHIIWPDMRLMGEGLGDTYSWYGYTKMSNYTVYFLVASKIAYIFKLFMGVWPYYRMPNLLLAIMLMVVMIKNVSTKKYLMLAFGVCVQAWYIFSYVTADALDFVFAFIALIILADENSVLWSVIKENEKSKRNTIRLIGIGLLYGMMLLGKPYYYSVMVLTFVVLVSFLLKKEKTERKAIFNKYLIVLITCLLVYGARAGLDFYYYGTDKANIELEMMEKYAVEDKKPSTPVEEQLQTYHAYDKGYPISFIFEDDPQWFAKSFRSYVSAQMMNDGPLAYFIIMGIMYAVIIVWISVNLYRAEGGKIVLFTGWILIIGGVVASVLNSYFIDSQPQGRYLLPIALITSYMSSRVPAVFKDKRFATIVLLTACLSVAYFGLVDSRDLIDLGYVRNILGL